MTAHQPSSGIYRLEYCHGRTHDRALNPFWMPRQQRYLTFFALPIVFTIWLIFLLAFKQNINDFGDEKLYHQGGIALSQSITNGTFLQDALNKDAFKHPGYFALAGVTYWLFGENSLLLRSFGFIPFFFLAVVISNIAALVCGERARLFAYLTALCNPVFLFFSLQLLRDIYLVFAVTLVTHAIICCAQAGLRLRYILTAPVLASMTTIYLFRYAQGMLTLFIFLSCLGTIFAFSTPLKRRKFSVILLISVTAIAGYLLRNHFLSMITDTFFDGVGQQISTTQLAALSDFSFGSADEMLAALINPKFLAVMLVAKLSNFALGPHPFSRTESNADLMDLFGNFSSASWGGYQWEDVLLVYGLQWMQNFAMLAFLVAGLLGLWRFNKKIFSVIVLHWAAYSIVTIFSGNEIRWGLPTMVLFCIIPSFGYALFSNRLKRFQLLSATFLLFTVAVRPLGVPVPMIAVPLALLGLMVFRGLKPYRTSIPTLTPRSVR